MTDGIESALRQACDVAGDKDVRISGGSTAIRQYLNAGFVDELYLHLAPVARGDGVRLLDGIDTTRVAFQPDSTVGSDKVTHIRYRIETPVS